MTDILRTQKGIQEASSASLVATYNAMTGKSIKKFSSRAAGESQVSNAILAGIDRAGKAGVTKGTTPTAMTFAEFEAHQSGKPAPKTEAAEPAKAEAKPAKAAGKGSLRAKLAGKAKDAPPNKGKPKVERRKAEGEPRLAKIISVKLAAKPSGARINTGSIREEVMGWINKRLTARAEKGEDAVVTMDELIKKFAEKARPAVSKLVVLGHLDAIRAEATE